MKKVFFECEFCKEKALEDFPVNWIHLKSLVVAKGVFAEGRIHDLAPTILSAYKREYDLTFCSLTCLTKWLISIFQGNNNPSASTSKI